MSPTSAKPDQQAVHPDHDTLIAAIEQRRLVVVVSKAARGERLVRLCAPLDYHPADGEGESSYLFWDLGANGTENLGARRLSSHEIYSISATEQPFEPADYAPLDATWRYPRNWGEFS